MPQPQKWHKKRKVNKMKLTRAQINTIIKEEITKALEDQHNEEDIFNDEPPGYAKQFIDPKDLYEHFDLDGDGRVSIEDYVQTLESYLRRPEVLDALKMRRYDKKGIYGKSGVLDTGRYLRSTQYHKPYDEINQSYSDGLPAGQTY
jgi:myosin heavy subunit